MTKRTPPISSEVLDRLPPNDPLAEISVVGSIFLDPRTCDDVAVEVSAADFYVEANRIVFGHLIDQHNSGDKIDTTLIHRRLKDRGDWERVGGAEYFAQVVNSVAVAAHAVHYAKIVRKMATLRALRDAATDILRDAMDETTDAGELLSRSERRIFAVADRRGVAKVRTVHDVLLDAMVEIDARMAGGGGAPGVATGFADLDKMLGGLHDSELIILAGRPGLGKTSLALNIVDYAAVDCDVPTLLVSLEMAEIELAQRILCSRAAVDGQKFRSGYLGLEDRERLVKASAKQSLSPLWIDDSPSRTVTEIAAAARRLKRQSGLALLVIDYLQLISPDDPRLPRHEQVGAMSRRLKALARELEVPVLCLAQLNREPEKSDSNRPKLSHLRSSGEIEQDADVVMFVHRDEYYRTGDAAREVKGQADILVRKQRNGPTGDVKLTWRAEFTQFTSRAASPDFGELDDDQYSWDPSKR